MESLPILSIITFLPLLGIGIIALIPGKNKNLVHAFITIFTGITFLISLFLINAFKADTSGFQFIEKINWIPSVGIQYFMGLDGISIYLVILTTFLTFIASISAYTAIEIRVKEFAITLLFLEVGMIGVFLALDLFLFYIFWELILIPMYLMIGIWGGKNRLYASLKFFLYTLAGSTLMLLAAIYMAYQVKLQTGQMSFSLLDMQALTLTPKIQTPLFLAFALAFAIKVPYFPFHTWLPDAHTEAPTAGSVILAGVLLKMGTYGFIRFNIPLFPDATVALAPFMSILAVVGIVYGAFMALVQTDVKRLVAYSSVSHMGFIMLGIFALNEEGLNGAVLQMLNHGISTGMLFLLVGMIYERRHTRMINEYGGIAKKMPIFAVYTMIAMLSSIALPGTNGFVGEFLILSGGFLRDHALGIIATSGVIFGAVYMLWMYQRVFLGKIVKKENEELTDLNFREQFILIPLVVLIFAIGVYPGYMLKTFKEPVRALIEMTSAKFNDENTVQKPNATIETSVEKKL
ncbi:MAG: NADH-quinone oxidoreductase subunit M [Spirochaetia bacterium]|nr:NADH-quinone oxidoreductase subunit M [Spirochaetia bacterium]